MTALLFSAQAGAAGAGGSFLSFAVQIGLLFVVFWFFLIRPQMQRSKQHRTMLSALRKGDQVVTGGGLIGKVVKLDEAEVELEIAPNVRVRAVRSTIAEVRPKGGAPAND